MFFEKRSPQCRTMRRLARRLEGAGIPYAVMGAMALNAHGAECVTSDVDVLLTPTGLESFCRAFVPRLYGTFAGRPRRFVDHKNGVTVDCLVTGHYPGWGRPGPIAFPDPAVASEVIDAVRVLTLPQLVELKLAARRYVDFGDVVLLIRVHDLDESFLPRLRPSVHRDFLVCLEEKRLEDEGEAAG
jgi:hypothetical protein